MFGRVIVFSVTFLFSSDKQASQMLIAADLSLVQQLDHHMDIKKKKKSYLTTRHWLLPPPLH